MRSRIIGPKAGFKNRAKRAANALLLSLTLPLLLPFTLQGQEQPSNISGSEAKAISTLADYTVSRLDQSDQLLQSHGYHPPVAADIWKHYPAVRKIEAAYLAAERAAPHKGGDQLLALLSQNLARSYEGVRHEKSLSRYLKIPTTKVDAGFINPSLKAGAHNLTKEQRRAILTLADYASVGPFGGPAAILQEHFSLDAEEAYRLLSESKTHAEAFERALESLPAESRPLVIEGLTQQVVKAYEASHYEPSLVAFMPKQVDQRGAPLIAGMPEPPPDRSPGFPGLGLPGSPRPSAEPRGSVPKRAPGTQGASDIYPSFVKEHYSSGGGGRGGGTSFESMIIEVGGFGGVILGNSVTRASGLPKIQSVEFEGVPSESDGRLWVVLEQGLRVPLEHVGGEDAVAAYRIVFSNKPTSFEWKPGEGVGLTGVFDNTPELRCEASRKSACWEGHLFKVVLHPALANLDLGWSALMSDALPIAGSKISQLVTKRNGKVAGEMFRALFNSMDSEDSLGTWKIVDVPTVVLVENQKVVVERDSRDGDFALGIRRTNFIELHPLVESYGKGREAVTYDSRFAEAFYQNLALLTSSSHDYDRLNRFARVLALIRLARKDGAHMTEPQVKLSQVATPDALRIHGNVIKAAPQFNSDEVFEKDYECLGNLRQQGVRFDESSIKECSDK